MKEVPTSEYEEDLHEAKSTVLLQQKQLANYEKLIKKQNDKIQLLRSFIIKQHGKSQLDKVEAAKPSSSSFPPYTISKNHSTTRGCTMPLPMKNKTTTTATASSSSSSSNSNSTKSNHNPTTLPKDDDDAMVRVRLGEKDMHSFFFGTETPSTRPPHWETISISSPDQPSSPPQAPSPPPRARPLFDFLDNNDYDNGNILQSPQAPPPPPPPVQSSPVLSQHTITEISSQSSHTTDEDGTSSSFVIQFTPPRAPRQSVIISPISYTPFQEQSRQTQQRLPPKSPTDRHLNIRQQKQKQQYDNDQRPSTTTLGKHRYHPPSSSLSSASSFFKRRGSLTSIDINQVPKQRNEDHFLKRPAPDSEYPYAEVVRKKDERAKLHGVTCACCAKYFENSLSGTPKTIQDRIQKYSRHREKYKQPSTPPGFWDLDFPDSPLHG